MSENTHDRYHDPLCPSQIAWDALHASIPEMPYTPLREGHGVMCECGLIARVVERERKPRTLTADDLAAWLHKEFRFQWDECDHGTYVGGTNAGKPYAMCERVSSRLAAFIHDSGKPPLDEPEHTIDDWPGGFYCKTCTPLGEYGVPNLLWLTREAVTHGGGASGATGRGSFSGRKYLAEHPLTPEQEQFYGIPPLARPAADDSGKEA
ncbi:MAG: hypothetical protein ACYCZR_05070 [Burkholderiales bacterium]